ncbi:MAG: hypothetical protein ACLRUZ_11655 [Faecalimonas sp.]
MANGGKLRQHYLMIGNQLRTPAAVKNKPSVYKELMTAEKSILTQYMTSVAGTGNRR